MKTGIQIRFIPALLALLLAADVSAHGENTWNTYTIDRVNENVESRVQEARTLLADLIDGRRQVENWPLPELDRLKDQFLELEKDIKAILDHYAEDGLDVQSAEVLWNNPTAGRTVSAGQALEAGIELLYHITALEDQRAFVSDIRFGGVSDYMYQLLGAHQDRMDLYGRLIRSRT